MPSQLRFKIRKRLERDYVAWLRVQALAQEQVGLESGEAAQSFDDLGDECLLVGEELFLAEQHAGEDLEAAADDPAFVGGAVLHDQDPGS